MALFQCLEVPCADTFHFTENLKWCPCVEDPWSLLSSVVFVFSVKAVTGCILYTSVTPKIPFVTLTNIVCRYAHKFKSVNTE